MVLHLGEQPQKGEIPGRPEETFKQTLLDHVTEASEGLDLKVALQNCYSEDSFFSVILENLGNYKNFQEISGLMFTKDKEHDLLCIPSVEAIDSCVSARRVLISLNNHEAILTV